MVKYSGPILMQGGGLLRRGRQEVSAADLQCYWKSKKKKSLGGVEDCAGRCGWWLIGDTQGKVAGQGDEW